MTFAISKVLALLERLLRLPKTTSRQSVAAYSVAKEVATQSVVPVLESKVAQDTFAFGEPS